ncbi:trypsin-like serine protease [Streptomyces sp. NPDC093544]|uniref:trypsin-like serine protease n=1 Tax=Streptomyces sp. NPDC093544 TaxID=3155200 RepID=UPI0034132749
MITQHTRPARLLALAAALIAAPLTVAAESAQAVTGTAQADNTYAFTARLDIGDGTRACTGTLVNAQWLLTAASCFADNPATSLTVPAGKPALKTTATIGRTDLTTTSGVVRNVVELVPHTDRDLVLARLDRSVTNVTPVTISTTTPAAGEELQVAGYGRTTDEWAPLKLHTGAFTVDSVITPDIGVTGKDGAAVCMGDTGGPALRVTNGTAELVAVNSRSAQGGCFGVEAAVTSTAAVDTRVDDVRAWVNAKVGAPRVTDFNCDGVEDVAVSDPKATVGGDVNAGLVRVIYGGGKGNAEFTQDLAAVPGGAEAGDGFGEQLAVFDRNEDGCTDLVVGVPAEDVGTVVDAGQAQVLYGARDGLTTGEASVTLEQGAGSGAILSSASETADRMGHSLAAGHTALGEPYLLIGVPGEDIGTITDSGGVYYLRSSANVNINQDTESVTGVGEAGDRFGTSITASPNHIAIGAPAEAVGDNAASGAVWVFSHALNSVRIPTPVAYVDQDTAGISGAAEANDEFGSSLSAVAYRPSDASAATDSILAVGSPGEAFTVGTANRTDAGRVVTLRVTAAGAISELADINQDAEGIANVTAVNDRFGAKVSAVNTTLNSVSTAASLRLAVGSPGEDIGTASAAGAVQTFSLLGAPGDTDFWIEAGNGSGLPGTPGSSQLIGNFIHATGTQLYIGAPNGPATYGAVHALPWATAASGTTGAVTTYQPGQNGLPAAGSAFGTAIR